MRKTIKKIIVLMIFYLKYDNFLEGFDNLLESIFEII